MTQPIPRLFRSLLPALSLLCLLTQAHAQSDEVIWNEVNHMDWKVDNGLYDYPGADARLLVGDQDVALIGADAARYAELSQGSSTVSADAMIVRNNGDDSYSEIYYSFHDIGFIKLDDWNDTINADDLLTEITAATEANNRRIPEGYAKATVDGWLREPYLNRRKATLYWAIAAHDSDGNQIVNAQALKLTRRGYANVLWVGESADFKSAQTTLAPALEALQMNSGASYADFTPGVDSVAAIGAGALAYSLMTGKSGQPGAGILAMGLVLLKKFGALLLLPFLWTGQARRGGARTA